MTQEQDVVERLLDWRYNGQTYMSLRHEAAQTIAALRVERDEAAAKLQEMQKSVVDTSNAAFDYCERAEAAEAQVKELEAEVSNLDAELDHWSQLAVDDIGKNPPTSWKEIAETAIRERDDWKERATIMHRRAQQAEAPAMAMRDYKAMMWQVFPDAKYHPEKLDKAIEAYTACDGVDLETLKKAREHWKSMCGVWHQYFAKEQRKAKEAKLERDQARKALERLGSSEVFTIPFMIKDNSEGKELLARIDFARSALVDNGESQP